MEKEYDFQKTCRACLNEDNNLSSIFDLTVLPDNQIPAIDFVRRLTTLKLLQGDGLPENICLECSKQINLAYWFSQSCIESDAKLRSQRNRTVLHSIQQEIVEEELEIDEPELIDEVNLKIEDEQSPYQVQSSDNANLNKLHAVQPVIVLGNKIKEESDTDEKLILICDKSNSDNEDDFRQIDDDIKETNKTVRRTYRKVKTIKCRDCADTFSTEEKLNEHYLVHDINRVYKCNECDKTFLKEYHLSVHARSHLKSEDKEYSCKDCGEHFSYLYLLKQHSYKHSDEKPFPCTKCPKGCLTAESLRRHMKIHDENYKKKTHACNVCSKEFPYPSFLIEHMKNHTGERPYLCSLCGKGFRQIGSLGYHMRSHTGYKPFSCNVCNKKFISQGILTVHMRKHTNERPYVCDTCGVAFRQSTDLCSHKRRHTGEKPFLCTVCGKKMSTTGQLTVHLRSHTGEKPFSCKVCPKSFATNTMLTKHERIHSGERPYVCNICKKAFNQSSTLKTHLNTHRATTANYKLRFILPASTPEEKKNIISGNSNP